MKPFNTLSDIRARSAEAILSQSSVRNTALLGHLRSMFNSPSTAEGGLLQQPIVEGAQDEEHLRLIRGLVRRTSTWAEWIHRSFIPISLLQ